VRVQFRPTPNVLFAAQCGPKLDPNALALHLQPNEGISLRFNGKVPGTSLAVRPVRMHFSYDAEFGAYTPEAYERLLLEAMAGDATLFIRRDEVETAWQIVDGIRQTWDGKPLSEREFLRGRHVGAVGGGTTYWRRTVMSGVNPWSQNRGANGVGGGRQPGGRAVGGGMRAGRQGRAHPAATTTCSARLLSSCGGSG